jgi:hypothetical protein
MTLDKVYEVAKIILCITLSSCLIVGTHDWHSLSGELHGTAVNLNGAAAQVEGAAGQINGASAAGRKYIDFQARQFESPAYQKWLAASLQMPAMFNATARSLNRETVPALNGEIADLRTATSNLATFISDTDKTTNGEKGLIPAATAVLAALGTSTNDLDSVIKSSGDKLGIGLDQANKLLKDPGLQTFLDDLPKIGSNLDSMTQELSAITGNLETASEYAPQVMELWVKMEKAASKWQKAYYLARILSLLLPIFFSPIG